MSETPMTCNLDWKWTEAMSEQELKLREELAELREKHERLAEDFKMLLGHLDVRLWDTNEKVHTFRKVRTIGTTQEYFSDQYSVPESHEK